MDILQALRDRVQMVETSLTSGLAVREVVMKHEHDIIELQRYQLLEGLTGRGEDIRPYYSEDIKPSGYFHTTESAGRYAAWKQDLTYPYSANRNPDAPNLYINGKFHEELGVTFGIDLMLIEGMTGYAKQIVAKYGFETFGLMWEKWSIIWQERGGLNEIMQEIKRMLYV